MRLNRAGRDAVMRSPPESHGTGEGVEGVYRPIGWEDP
jgi:hypothetical protein